MRVWLVILVVLYLTDLTDARRRRNRKRKCRGRACKKAPVVTDPKVLIRNGKLVPTTPKSFVQRYGFNCGKTINDFKAGEMLWDGDDLRIINGQVTKVDQFPWQVVFAFRLHKDQAMDDWSQIKPFCGGTIISPEWILTAAHCVKGQLPRFMRVYAGLSSTRIGDLSQGHRMEIENFYIHPDYQYKGPNKNDIALVKVKPEYKMHFGVEIYPACLPDNEFCLENGSQVNVTGFGTIEGQKMGLEWSNDLRFASVPILSKEACAEEPMSKNFNVTITYKNEFCAGNGAADACTGDSGGPIVFKDPRSKVVTLVGAVSWGYGCSMVGFPGIYVKVSQFTHWIAQTSGVYIEGMDYTQGLSNCTMNHTKLMTQYEPEANELHEEHSTPAPATTTAKPTSSLPSSSSAETTIAATTTQTTTTLPPTTASTTSTPAPSVATEPYKPPALAEFLTDPFPNGKMKIAQRCLDVRQTKVNYGWLAWITQKNSDRCFQSKIHEYWNPIITYTQNNEIQVIKQTKKRRGKITKYEKFCLTYTEHRQEKSLLAKSIGKNKDKNADILRWELCGSPKEGVLWNQKFVVEKETKFLRPLEDPLSCLTYFRLTDNHSLAKLTRIADKCVSLGAYRESDETGHAYDSNKNEAWNPEW